MGHNDLSQEYKKIIAILPAYIVNELELLKEDRYDDSVTDEEWQSRSKALMLESRRYPKAIKHNFIRAVKILAKEERQNKKYNKK